MTTEIKVHCPRCGRGLASDHAVEGEICGGCSYIAEHPEFPINVTRGEYDDAIEKAWSNLARYKFSNFGYWAARVVFLGQMLKQLGAEQPPNPFRSLVHAARGEMLERQEQERIATIALEEGARAARLAAGAEFLDNSEDEAFDRAADHNAPVWYPGDEETDEDERAEPFGHRMTSRINRGERCVDIVCFGCPERWSAASVDQAARIMVRHILDTEGVA